MGIIQQLEGDLKTAMIAREKEKRDTLRLVLSDMKNKKIELGRELEEPEALAVLAKAKKSRQDSLAQYTDAGREDLAAVESAEIAIIADYLPEEMSEEELREIVTAVVAEVGASSPKEMGAVMAALMPKVKGRADGKAVQRIVMELLS
jgi:uncharacterized protein YqeY